MSADNEALDPLVDLEEVVARENQKRQLAMTLNGVHEGYLPPTDSVSGQPGAGKTLPIRRLGKEVSEQIEVFGDEYMNLKVCRTQFSAAKEILVELGGEKRGTYERRAETVRCRSRHARPGIYSIVLL